MCNFLVAKWVFISFSYDSFIWWLSGGAGKKEVHVATPYPVKKAGKTPANSDKSKQQTPKSTSPATCDKCARYSFISIINTKILSFSNCFVLHFSFLCDQEVQL